MMHRISMFPGCFFVLLFVVTATVHRLKPIYTHVGTYKKHIGMYSARVYMYLFVKQMNKYVYIYIYTFICVYRYVM